jgi:hypothetical protein
MNFPRRVDANENSRNPASPPESVHTRHQSTKAHANLSMNV